MSSLLHGVIEFISWRYSQSCWYFRPSFVNYCPSGPPFPKSKYIIYRQFVAGTIFCRGLKLCIWPDSEPTKLPYHPKQKPRRGGGPLLVNFYEKADYRVVSLKIFGPCPLSSDKLGEYGRNILSCMVTTFCIAFYESSIPTINSTHWGPDHESDIALLRRVQKGSKRATVEVKIKLLLIQ